MLSVFRSCGMTQELEETVPRLFRRHIKSIPFGWRESILALELLRRYSRTSARS